MSFNNYTTADAVRGLLGVSSAEVEDNDIENNERLLIILEALDEISAAVTTTTAVDLAADYLALRDAVAPRTAIQNRLCLQVQTFASYVVAVDLIPAMPLFAPKVIMEGKASSERVDNPFDSLRPTLEAARSYIRGKLIATYASINSAVTAPARKARTLVTAVGIATDPVTGA